MGNDTEDHGENFTWTKEQTQVREEFCAPGCDPALRARKEQPHGTDDNTTQPSKRRPQNFPDQI